jgi:predicted dehydrogenase
MIPSPTPTRIGVLGAGAVSRDLHLPVLANIPDVVVPWVCDRDESAARQLARACRVPAAFSRLEDCPDVDVVVVAIPVGSRASVMPTVLDRGWHAFCEKPFAASLAEHDRFVAQARARGLQVGVGLVRRYAPATLHARELVRSGRLGPVTRAWASEGFRMTRTGRDTGWYLAEPEAGGGGVLMETGSHLLDQLFTILDAGRFRIFECTQRRHSGLDFETRILGEVSTDSQPPIPCAFELSWLDDLCSGLFIEHGDVVLKCGLYFDDSLDLLAPDGTTLGTLEVASGTDTPSRACHREWQDFLRQCATGDSTLTSVDMARETTGAIENAYEIARADEEVTGRPGP